MSHGLRAGEATAPPLSAGAGPGPGVPGGVPLAPAGAESPFAPKTRGPAGR